ncbi:MAG: hypothetical protein F6K28_24005 [Microcoleus sp. SIO2G3]|nr:hypothetical protein [Microcoleus sp. SIO2G3]
MQEANCELQNLAMSNNLNQPKAYDVVLGGQTPVPVNGAVLGGLLVSSDAWLGIVLEIART